MRRYRNFKRRRQERRGYHRRRDVFTNDLEKNTEIRYPSNYISTTKYNPITFLPKNLWEQFHRVANVFFVFVMVLTLLPTSPVIPGPQVAAVATILIFQMVKDIVEDSRRKRSDVIINAKPAHVLCPESGEVKQRTWGDVKVGDILRVDNNCEIPADLLLLSSSRPSGECFVETANLDGETNLKRREAHPYTCDYDDGEKLKDLRVTVDADEPNPKLYKFDGAIVLDEKEEMPLTIDSFLHRGTMVRNTEFVYGLVLYTGHQTKFMLNVAAPRHKMSKLERVVNRCIIGMLIAIFALSLLSAIIGTVVYEYDITEDHWYILFEDQNGAAVDTFMNFLTFIVVYANLIPLSLYVNLEIIRLVQARLMGQDRYMYDKNQDARSQARSTNLMEELGQVEFVFSDKTGTLTLNNMVFKALTAGDRLFGEVPDLCQAGEFDEDEYLLDVDDEVDENAVEMDEVRKTIAADEGRAIAGLDKVSDEGGPIAMLANDALLNLSLCNTVTPTVVSEELAYLGPSPDEVALAHGAKRGGFRLLRRTVDEVAVEIHGEEHVFEVLAINAFTSNRRRMSVILRCPDKSIRLLIKGADEAIFARTRADDPYLAASHAFVDDFAAKGLRTLVLGQRHLTEEEFDEWAEQDWNTARLATKDRDHQLAEAAEKIEQEIELVGTTGIEDRLQDAVGQTISDLLRAGMRIWVLTGDKRQTAINIAEACCLITPDMNVIKIAGKEDDVGPALVDAIDKAQEGPACLVIDGDALAIVMEEDSMQDDLVTLGKHCQTVVACRSTPIQKQQMVTLIKTHLSVRTMAVGDGANDVAMIQAAHVGVGIRGNEGMQAVMASDFVISQFRFLRRLLLVHGRWNYNRIAYLVCYLIFKNVVLTLSPFWFAFFNQWSGQVYFDPWIRIIWNMVFTAAPIIVYCVLEQDVPADLALKYPELYRDGPDDVQFNGFKFFQWTCFAIWDGLVAIFGVFVSVYGLGFAVDSDGNNADYWMTQSVSYTVLCFSVNLHLFLHTRYWNCITQWSYWLTLISWPIFAFIYCSSICVFLESPPMYWVWFNLLGSPSFYFVVVVLVWMALLPDIIIHYVRRTFFPRPVHVVQEIANSSEYRAEHPPQGKWCCEKGDCCCNCMARLWCNCC